MSKQDPNWTYSHFDCECHTHVLRVGISRFKGELVDIDLRQAWQILTTGEAYGDQFCLDPKQAAVLRRLWDEHLPPPEVSTSSDSQTVTIEIDKAASGLR